MSAKSFFLAIATVLLASCGSQNTERLVPGVPVTEWSFSLDGASWENVQIPHSYNAIDGHSEEYYRGEACYKTTLPEDAADALRYLLFEGAAQSATVIVGGDTLCTHNGGYTPFWVDVTGRGGSEVKVICENRENLDRIPLSSDFNKNGGIHNPVWLLKLPAVHFSPEAYGLYRLHVSTPEVSEAAASGFAETRLCNTTEGPQTLTVQWQLKNASGKTVLSKKENVTLEPGAARDLRWDFDLKHPHLWDGLTDPYLYTIGIKAGEDYAETEIGFRYFALDREKGFFLNGRPYPLRGTGMHQDKAGIASALTKADYDEDYAFVRELGCNFLRLAHYPHNDYAFRLCDRMGIVVQTEIPWVNNCGTEASDAYIANVYSQMEEMVTSLYNHPCIIFWGMWNELDAWGHKPELGQGTLDARRVVDETAKLYAFTKELDPYRPVGLTDDSMFKRDFYKDLKADFYSENRYHGWYYGRFEKLTADIQWIRDTMGVTNLSEYGVGVNPFCHTWKEEDIRRDKTDSLHMEEYGNRFHESYAAQIAQAPYLNFSSIWILFDFAVAARQEGFMDTADGINFTVNPERKYTNDKGLVTRDRSVRKDAFYLYKAWWNSSEETVYIASGRLERRPAGEPFTLTVYSNAPSLKVLCDGRVVGEATESGEPTGVVWKFPVQMGDGPTTFTVVSPKGTSHKVTWLPL
jgi:beta-galactosidase